ncbi:MAG: flagellar basal body protein [Myxococcales bacterium]|nr:flagellar basal body protein [Myxococcales bacterium]
MDGVFSDPITSGLERVLDLRQQQHALTASNLANAETPGFKAKVVDFQRELSRAMEPSPSGAGPSRVRVIEMEAAPWSTDGNSVLAEREQARLQENALMFRAVARGLSRRLAMLKYAAGEGR